MQKLVDYVEYKFYQVFMTTATTNFRFAYTPWELFTAALEFENRGDLHRSAEAMNGILTE